MNCVYLSRRQGAWLARFTGPHAQDAEYLFGSACVPVPCPGEASADQVLRHVRELVPDSMVKLEAEAGG